MKIIHNKLVRDNIPGIIEANHKTCTTRILEDNEYNDCLKDKLVEEANEVRGCWKKENLISEIADVLEVIEALIEHNHLDIKEIESYRKMKVMRNGAFEKRIFLESVEE